MRGFDFDHMTSAVFSKPVVQVVVLRVKIFVFHFIYEILIFKKIVILSFDCKKDQPLPNLPDQSSYYSRQLYFNKVCFVKGHSTRNLSLQNKMQQPVFGQKMNTVKDLMTSHPSF